MSGHDSYAHYGIYCVVSLTLCTYEGVRSAQRDGENEVPRASNTVVNTLKQYTIYIHTEIT